MKRILAVALTLLICVMSVTISAGAAGDDFAVEVRGAEKVSIGSEVVYTVSIVGKSDVKFVGFQIKLGYDPEMLEYKSFECENLNGWTLACSKVSDGELKFDPICDAFTEAASITKGSSNAEYKLKFTVKDTSKKTSDVSVSSANGMDLGGNSYSGVCGSVTLSVVHKLTAPTGLGWKEISVAEWDAVEGASDYSVQLYKDKKSVGKAVKTGGKTQLDLSESMKESGAYTYTVTAVAGKDGLYTDSDASAQSSSVTVTGPLATPKIEINSDMANGGIKYQITDTNSSGSVARYEIEIYAQNSDTAVKTVTVTSLSGNIPCDSYIKAGQSYSTTVKAVSKNKDVALDSSKSAKGSSVVAANKITAMSLVTPPKTLYKEGETIDLSGLKIKVTYQDGTVSEIGYSEFDKNGIKCDPSSGSQLKLDDNGKIVVLTSPSGVKMNVISLSIESGNCKHENTQTVHVDASCGTAGYDNIVCTDCGITVSTNTIPATGEHIYGDWTPVVQATEFTTGLKVRICSICSARDEEELPKIVPGEDTTASGKETKPAVETSAVTTSPAQTDDQLNGDEEGGMSNLSKIFLIAVIVVFALVVGFIIFGVWSDRRRSNVKRVSTQNRTANRGNNVRRNGTNNSNRSNTSVNNSQNRSGSNVRR